MHTLLQAIMVTAAPQQVVRWVVGVFLLVGIGLAGFLSTAAAESLPSPEQSINPFLPADQQPVRRVALRGQSPALPRARVLRPSPEQSINPFLPADEQPTQRVAYKAPTVEPVFVEPLDESESWSDEGFASDITPLSCESCNCPACQTCQSCPPGRPSDLPPGTREGVFQKVDAWGSWIPRFESDGLGISQVGANVVFGFPLMTREAPLVITPQYAVNFLDGPDFIDVPSRLHDAQVDFHHFRRLNDRWLMDLAVTLGVYADDHSFDSSDAFRVTGRALGIYDLTPEWKALLGVVYLNRSGTSVVPAVGLTYRTEDVQYDLVFPRPRFAWRTWSCGPPGCDERWWYLQGEIGGGNWAVQRASGADDQLSYTDYRFLVGTERKIVGGLSHRMELGYIFGRELEYDSVGSDIEIDDSLFVRLGLTY